MSKTVLCVLLKVLTLARADVLSKYPDSDFIQNSSSENNDYHVLQNLESDRDHPNGEGVRNKIDDILFANMSVIPESIESILNKPTSPRAFVEFYDGFLNEETNISVTFRWNQPEFTDEVIQGYTVQCWFIENQKKIQICDGKSISATILEYTVHNLKSNTTYYFQVQAHTKVGTGPYTDLIDVSTLHENPIPQLLIVSDNVIAIWDLDTKININLVEEDYLFVTNAIYSMAEHKIYWSDVVGSIMMYNMNENNIIEIVALQNSAQQLCIDWVARNLYWLQEDENTYNIYYIMKLDLTMWENGIIKNDKISKTGISDLRVLNLHIVPFMGILHLTYYTKDKKLWIMQMDLDGKNARNFQKNYFAMCPFSFNALSFNSMKIDDTKKPLIYWLTNDLLIVTDINVSMCNLILQIEKTEVYKMFESIMIDKTNIYIFMSVNDYLYVLKKKYARLESVDAFKYIQKIEKFSWFKNSSSLEGFNLKPLQSYPPTKCLTPEKRVYNIEEVMVTTSSISVNLPEPGVKSGCERYNLPTTLYTIHISYCLDNELNKFDNITIQTYERYYEIQNLTAFTEYKLLLVISNFYSDQLSMDPLFGSEVTLRTEPSKLDAPENVTVQALTPNIAAVYWMPPEKLNCVPVIYKVYWKLVTNSTEQINKALINNIEHKADSKFVTIIESLIPQRKYMIYVRMHPVNYSDLYVDSSSKILYMYLEPNNIILNGVSINSMNISWIPSVNSIINYELEYKNVEMQEWQIANNFESNNEKIMYYFKTLLPGTRYEFRLILRYPKYEKNFTWPSDGRFIFSTLTMYRQRKEDNEQVLPPIMTDIELAILHEIPNGNVQFNTLYNPILEYNSNEYILTEIKRDQIRLEKLLGNGAFGMVFQGKVKNLETPGTEIPAAIKKLRKNASSQEKKKFLEEARLMNHFRHKHVLRLLAVCLDEDSPLIVLELMKIGDLLQYLRDNRNLQPSDLHALRLQDLFAMCEDVARGCCYLENLHFIHRDLACRNCLVSSRDRENRIVKIGDFGLARDVYKADYYRKKGQGLLPICWMAPESLVIGIFTSQSDVWSFGVLMWEITSLGEHPYVGRTNLEVIDYVRAGGRLPMPLNCPPTLYELMLRCWSPSSNDRPNFKLCLENIIALRNNIEDTLLSPVDIV